MDVIEASRDKEAIFSVFPRELELVCSIPNIDHIPNTTIPITDSLLTKYLASELVTHDLDSIRDHLWFAGLPRVTVPLKHLHHHRVLGRNIVLTEKIELHLTSRGSVVYLKPVPQFLLQHDFFHRHVYPSRFFQHACGFLSTYTSLIKYEYDFRLAQEHYLLSESITWNSWLQFSDSVEQYLAGESTQG